MIRASPRKIGISQYKDLSRLLLPEPTFPITYTTTLFQKGVNRMAQKVGEEAVETVIEATNGTEDGFIYEASDLVYHLIVLLTSKGLRLEDLARELKKRHKG